MKVLDLLLLFAVGSFLGVVIETIYCYLAAGKFMRRQSVVYGPFNQIYGIGAVLMTTLLSRLPDKSAWVLFLSSAILGGLFEAICSCVQEVMYGTVSWEYSGQRFSLLGGRTSLRFMVFWGILGIAYMRGIQPFLFRLFAQIPLSVKAPAVIALSVFLAYDLWLSALAVGRWRRRLSGQEPYGSLDIWLDKKFPNKRMMEIYPSMKHSPHIKSGKSRKEKAPHSL